jgi:carbamoyl-phosphate synthase/aspartate carbamoyltransferase/dihydroorotase
MLILPGLIDPHVHLREPGATHKEDFDSGTAAALAGGFTTVLAMPNTKPPLTDAASLSIAEAAASAKARCDYGLYLGAGDDNSETVFRLAARACGLKLYLDQTYGPLRLNDLDSLQKHMAAWPAHKLVVAHAEGRSLAAAILLCGLLERPLHISHVSRADEIRLIAMAKQRGFQLTCEVTPHHLFLTEGEAVGMSEGRRQVRPRLATQADRQALWDHLSVIDCFATDHAPHTIEEKDGENPPPGFPGLETALPLLLAAVHENRLTLEQLMERMVTNPRRIFALPQQEETSVEVDEDASWTIRGSELYSRCGWTPFEGMVVHGRIRKVVLRGQIAFEDGQVLAQPGTGRNVAAVVK